jgi:hypothetical protein
MNDTLEKIREIITGLLGIIKIFIPDKSRSVKSAEEIKNFTKTIKKNSTSGR